MSSSATGRYWRIYRNWLILVILRNTDKQLTDLYFLESRDFEVLYQPYNCDRDVYDLMLECWEKHTEDRPDFQVSSHEAFCPLFKYYLPGNITFSHAEEPWLRPVLWLNKLHLISPFFQNLCLMKVYIENLVRKYTLYPLYFSK